MLEMKRGQHFGLLTVLTYVGQNRHHKAVWRCRCACGTIKQVRGDDLRNGDTKSWLRA
jgi:hypothetical protein